MAHVDTTPEATGGRPAPNRLAAMRRGYDAVGLDVGSVAPTWLEQFERWLDEAIAEQAPEPNAMTLATVDADGRPSARTVLCKRVDSRGLVFFTNLRSRKGMALAADPRVALTFCWLTVQRQVCITGDAESVDRAQTEAYAQSRPRGSQLSVWASPQSAVIADRDFLTTRKAAAEGRYEGAPVPVPPFWGAFRVLPRTVEFWAGRPDRLHDRVRFRRRGDALGSADDGGWVVERLAP